MPNTDPTPQPKEAWLFLIGAGLCWMYVITRALWVPLVHDEANSFFHFIKDGSWVPFMGKWDAANHVLAMAMGKLGYTLFGPGAFALRSSAVLCYPLLAWCTWRMGNRIADPLVRWCLWAALLAMPFAMEFFALFRGYGPSFAFLLWAMAMGLDFLETGRTRAFVLAALALGLGVNANLSLLPIWAVGLALLASGIARGSHTSAGGRKPLLVVRIAAWLGAGLSPGLWMIAFAMGLRERGLLYYGSDRGLLAGSFASLRERLTPELSNAAGIAICIALFMFVLAALVVVIRQREQRRYPLLVLVCVLLGAEFLARWVLGEAFGVLYPKDRAMLHFVPLLLIAFATAVDRYARSIRPFALLALPLLILPFHTIATADLHSTTQWPEESISDAVRAAVQERQAASDTGLLVTGSSPLCAIWDHKLYCGGNAFATVFPSDTLLPWADLLLADARKPERWKGRFTVVLGPKDSGQWLLEPIQRMQRRPVWDSVFAISTTRKEFMELYAAEPDPVGAEGLVVDLSTSLSAPAQGKGELLLVVQVDAADGSRAFYHAQRLDRQWNTERTQEIRAVVAVPRTTREGDRLVVFVWDPVGRELALNDVRLRIQAVLPSER